VKSENEDFLDLIKADGSMVRLELDDVEARRKGKSSMPDDLIDKLTMRQLRDLVAYLSSLTTDPRSADEVE
jgi:quinoprotein glucose dehydrogenase